MKILLVSFTRKEENYISEGVAEFEKRIRKYNSFETKIIKAPSGANSTEQLKAEEKLLAPFFTPDAFIILLDEKGIQFSSKKFADFLQTKMNSGKKNLVFVIGGAYGFSAEVKKKASDLISLSALTFPHQLAKLIFCEQLYRAFTILRGEKYHHE
ncbi:MAG TPA: 23S rRNA (pseudouridine(1915)-N(3))-methyltransferase RlmH [Bacteroidetes bacterium]|nr:23S rRNA (pseudouridine(1915)-N(3))-methyltransferase RlmH [Bacteroidota bacterium]